MAVEANGGSSGLLLRLFESDFFNVHLAIGYLKRNASSIGITHYLVNRLRSFEPSEVEFYWAQLCYLVITRPTPSVALENFILERCELDPHIAVITLWIFQSCLSDLQLQPTTLQFNICRRVFNRVQSIIFTDPPNPSNEISNLPASPQLVSSTSNLTITSPIAPGIPSTSLFPWIRSAPTKKINSTLATLVGIGAMSASVGLPALATGSIGRMTIDQGYTVDNENMVRGGKSEDDDDDEDNSESGSETGRQILKPVLPPKVMNGKGLPASPGAKGKKAQPNYLPGDRLDTSPLPNSNLASFFSRATSSSKTSIPSSPYLPTTSLFSKTATSSVPSSSSSSSSWKFTEPPIASASSHRTRPTRHDGISLSVPSLPTATQSASYLPNSGRSATLSNNPSLGLSSSSTSLPPEFLSHLLLLQSCRSQLDLLRSLQDISTRLVLVPKQARLSSLRAELTVLNHGLPRGCCLGMSCSGSSFSPSSSSHLGATPTSPSKPTPHDRIVRISPSESAVLNSADRAPFVIHVEVLIGDLDFDPSRRQNAEDLRRALKERERSMGGSSGLDFNGWKGRMSLESGLDNNGLSGSSTPNKRIGQVSRLKVGMSSESDLSSGIAALGSLQSYDAKSKEPEVEIMPNEMDMVEQLYGSVSIQDAKMIDSLGEVEDPSIQNREVDELAWARIHDGSDIKGKDLAESTRPSTPFTPVLNQSSSSQLSSSTTLSPPTLSSSTGSLRPTTSSRPTISLDQYAERMRMAAIMLSQLDASQAAAMSVVATGTAAAGTLVGLPVATVAGIGGVVGAGLAKISAPFLRRDVQPGQGSTGVHASLDKESAAAGTSFVAGAPPLPALPVSSLASSSSSLTTTNPSNHNQRARLLTPSEASAIRNRIMDEMLILEEERMIRMKLDGNARSGWSTGGGGIEDGAVVMRAVNKDDPSGAVFRESFASKTSRIRAASPYGHLASWNVISVIVKTGADLRQEQLAIQLIKEFGRIWKEEHCPAWVRYFRILVTSEGSGLIETITDAVSIHSIKKDAYARTAADGTQVFTSFTLLDHYIESYGHINSSAFRKAQKGFVSSLAAYSVICYLLQLKDRHNGNILVDRDGHLIHIDFGFMLSNSPGSLGFEMAPFKLPQEYIDVLGGFDSENFAQFKSLFKSAFRAARKHAERIITLVELMQKDSSLPCFALGESTSQQLRERFQLSLTTSQVDEFVERLILSAATSSFTRLYDLFQGYSNGIL